MTNKNFLDSLNSQEAGAYVNCIDEQLPDLEDEIERAEKQHKRTDFLKWQRDDMKEQANYLVAKHHLI